MSDPATRYRELIAATLRHALRTPRTSVSTLEPIVPLIATELDAASTVPHDARAPIPTGFDFTDGAGHRRPPYRGIAMRTVLRDRSAPADAREAFRALVMPSLAAFGSDDAPLAATDASRVLSCVFDALAVESDPAATDDDRSITRRCFSRLIHNQQSDGTFLARSATDNPEPLWYAELALLHATHVHAVEQADDDARAASARAAQYLAAEVQPDHASSHPWAIAALLEQPDGIQLADMMLHAAGVQEPRSMDAVSLLLLADVLRCSRREPRR